ncbi:MAG: hypothetical protein ACTSRR_05905 [Candidatus Heimdallarchaeaceae archaeon]
MINLTFSTLIMFISTIPEFIALVMCAINFRKKRYLHYLYMFATWFFLWLGNLLLAIGYLTLNLVVYKVGLLVTIPLTFFIMLLVDSISRESIEPFKLSIVMIVSTLAFAFGLEKNVVALNVSKLGEVGPIVVGRFNYALAASFLVSSVLWFYYFLVLYLKSPKNLRKIASINLLGAIIGGPLAGLAYASGIVWYLPGTDYFLIAIGALLTTYSFSKEPKLGYILPFKVSRLLLIDIESGLPLFSHTWDNSGLVDSYLFSGAIHGITNILNESLHKGLVKEIRLEEASLIIKASEEKDYPVAFVLITNKTSAILSQSLDLLEKNITRTIPKEKIEEITINQSSNLESYIESAFPYVVSYT